MKILLAGGAGYIGSHTAVELLQAGHEVIVVDDYSNSCPVSIARVEQITGKKVHCYEADVKDNAHLKAIEYAVAHQEIEIFNVGTGKPYSVLEIIKTFEEANGVKVNYEIGPRRAGDLPEVWADASKAAVQLHWQARYTLADMCRDAWSWQSKNPQGYAKD